MYLKKSFICFLTLAIIISTSSASARTRTICGDCGGVRVTSDFEGVGFRGRRQGAIRSNHRDRKDNRRERRTDRKEDRNDRRSQFGLGQRKTNNRSGRIQVITPRTRVRVELRGNTQEGEGCTINPQTGEPECYAPVINANLAGTTAPSIEIALAGKTAPFIGNMQIVSL